MRYLMSATSQEVDFEQFVEIVKVDVFAKRQADAGVFVVVELFAVVLIQDVDVFDVEVFPVEAFVSG